jgi:ribosomal protein L7/L12
MRTGGLKESGAAALPATALAALRQGDKIAAIRALRIERNMGLKEAKAIVDDYVRSRPELQQSFAAAWKRTISTKVVLLIVIVAVLLLLFRLFSRP